MKNHLPALALVAALGACTSLPHSAAQAPATPQGGVLADSHGMTLYVFDKDVAGSGKSVCNGPCAINWPPLLAADDSMAPADWSLVQRDDGNRQWAYKGRPLYRWSKDQKAGDMLGDGVNKVWHSAQP